jgi:hypothetical protein
MLVVIEQHVLLNSRGYIILPLRLATRDARDLFLIRAIPKIQENIFKGHSKKWLLARDT